MSMYNLRTKGGINVQKKREKALELIEQWIKEQEEYDRIYWGEVLDEKGNDPERNK